MNIWFVLLLLGSLLINVISRPQQEDYNNDSDVDETAEDDSDPTDDVYASDDDDNIRISDQEPTVQENEVPRGRRLMDLRDVRYLQRDVPDDNIARDKTDTLSDPRLGHNLGDMDEKTESINFNQPLRGYPKRRQSNKYSDTINERDKQHLDKHDITKSNQIQDDGQLNKRTVGFQVTANEDGDMIFEKNGDNQINKNEYNANDASDSEQWYFKQYYNAMQSENRNMVDGKSRHGAHYNLRDRREVDLLNQYENDRQESKETIDSEDEESAIKRHIRKLSSDELDKLLNSLTEDKKELLKKIIDDTDSNPNGFLNKREITKKAGAVEEISNIENCQSDLNKIQSGGSVLDVNSESVSSQSTDMTEGSSNQQQDSKTDNPDISPKSSESNLVSVSNVELSHRNGDATQKKSDESLNTFALNIDPKNQADVIDNIQVTSNTGNKREVSLQDLEEAEDLSDDSKLSGQDYLNDKGYLSGKDGNLVNVMDNENRQYEDRAHKREVFYYKQSEPSDSFNSLEDSFSNSNSYDDAVPYSGPLVRVKRKNCDENVKKRSAGLMPDGNVAYLPYKAETDDEDNDEGNEFDDEEFNDRASNFANDIRGIDDSARRSENSHLAGRLIVDDPKSGNAASLGSDTDNVLSGVEGIDDNLMYSCATRNRRTPEDKSSVTTEPKIDSSTSLTEENKKSVSENYAFGPPLNSAHCQEKDVFGPLPRNYDEDLARYKKIRMITQIHNDEGQNSLGT